MANNSYWDRSTSPSSNANYSSLLTWAEGQLPSTVNNSARQDLAYDAAYYDDQSGQNTVGGSANAITITPVFSIASYVDRMVYVIKAASDNTTAATFNVSGVGAKSIRKILAGTDAALSPGDIQAGNLYTLAYSSAANSAAGGWVLRNPSQILNGTFTPTIVSTGGGTGTYTLQSGVYTKIGRAVSFLIELTWTAHSGSGDMNILGLPFPTSSVTSASPCSILASSITFSNALGAYALGSTVFLNTMSSGAGLNTVPLDTAGSIYVSGTYNTTS